MATFDANNLMLVCVCVCVCTCFFCLFVCLCFQVRALEHELQQAWDQARRLGGGGGGGGGGGRERELGERDREASPLSLLQGQEEELSALKETVDDLSHQLSDNLEEAEELRRQ